MLMAIDEKGERRVAAEALKRNVNYYCPSCESAVYFKKGSVMRPHFAHYRDEACDIFSEGETAEHIQGKFDLLDYFKKEGRQVEMEGYLPDLQQRPDLLVDNRYAVEFQCSQIPIKKIEERTVGYLKAGYEVVWILGERFKYKKQLTAFQKACLVEWQGDICLFHYSVEQKKLTIETRFERKAASMNYQKKHQQLQKLLSHGAHAFQKMLYENGDSIVSMPLELYPSISHEWMIQGSAYIWKYHFILWLETLPLRRIITQKMIDAWIQHNITYYIMPQISARKKRLPVYEFIDVFVNSGVLKEVRLGKWTLTHYPKRYQYLEEKFQQKKSC